MGGTVMSHKRMETATGLTLGPPSINSSLIHFRAECYAMAPEWRTERGKDGLSSYTIGLK